MVEVAASILTMVQLYFLSSSIGDLIEKKAEANRLRNLASFCLTGALAAFFLLTKFFR